MHTFPYVYMVSLCQEYWISCALLLGYLPLEEHHWENNTHTGMEVSAMSNQRGIAEREYKTQVHLAF